MDNNFGLIGVSSYIISLRNRIVDVATGNFPIHIEGPSGTGKEIIAQAIHNNSNQKSKQIVSINCAAISESLQESELFGHTKGSFTGAYTDHQGLIQKANNSSLFLDEIGEISLNMQSKLLRVLDTGEFLPIGQTTPVKAVLRIISATNKNLQLMVSENSFRSDLFYRLKGATIKTEALVSHKEDIPYLTDYFLSLQTDPKPIDDEAISFLMSYDWPGNIRELKYVIEVINHASTNKSTITASTVASVLNINNSERLNVHPLSFKEEKSKVVTVFELSYFSNLLFITKGNVSQASRIAKMYRTNFSKKLKELNIDLSQFRSKNIARVKK